MAERRTEGGLNQGQGMRDAERLVSGLLGYAIVATLISVPILTIILLIYILAKFG